MLKFFVFFLSLLSWLPELLADDSEALKTIADLKKECLTLESDGQRNSFPKEVTCKGSTTFWIEKQEQKMAPCSGFLCGRTAYEKGQALSTALFNEDLTIDGTKITCNVYEQLSLEMREHSLVLQLESCDDFTEERISELCRSAVQEQMSRGNVQPCANAETIESIINQSQSEAISLEKSAICWRVIDRVETCRMYCQSDLLTAQ